MWKKLREMLETSYTDDGYRQVVLFELLNILLAVVAFVMTVVNVRTGEYELMFVTGAFAVLSTLNYVLVKAQLARSSVAVTAFSIEVVALLVYFVMGGVPQGFSALWTLLVPAVAMAVFGKKIGVRLCVVVFAMIVFFFWTPLGRGLLMYDYSSTFMLRFPFVYICLFLASWYLETVRLGAYFRLKDMEKNAVRLYRHDALTGVFTRYAFVEELQKLLEAPGGEQMSLVLLDLDDFKRVNDRYGHNGGDEILRTLARIIHMSTCEHCVTCRWGGEEFLLLMRCQHDAYETAEKIRRTMEATTVTHRGETIRATVSVGVAVAKAVTAEQMDDFVNCADHAMYASKVKGKNQTTLEIFQ